jgi:hypothetical protein
MDALAKRVFGWASVDDGPHRWHKLRAAWVVVSLHVCIRLMLALWFAGAPRYLMALPALAFVAGLWRRFMRPVAIGLALVQCVRFSLTYPDVSNHYLVECLTVLVFAAVDLTRDEERELCGSALCWLVVVVLLISGLQKCLHGLYFKGQYLAYMVATTDRFRRFFAPLLPATELMRLDAFRAGPQHGHYRVDSLSFMVVSNLVWLSEMAVGVGLLVRRARPLALIGGLILMLGILGSSNELFFDTLFINLMLLFARANLIGKLMPLTLVAYGYYLSVGLGIVPGGFVW